MAVPTTPTGVESTIGIGEETTYGTAVAATEFYYLLEPPSIDLGRKKTLKPVMGNAFTRKATDARREPTISFKILVSYDELGFLLAHAIGDSSVATTGSGPYTHTIAGASMPVGLTVEADYGAASMTGGTTPAFTGCQISKLSITQAHNDFAEVSVECTAEDVAQVTKASPTYPTDNFLEYASLGTVEINSVAQNARSCELTISNELRSDRFNLGSKSRVGIGRKRMTVTGKIEVEMDAMTEMNLSLNGTDTPITLTWTGASSHSLTITFQDFTKQDPNPTASGDDDWIVPVEFDADGDKLTATLINADASY